MILLIITYQLCQKIDTGILNTVRAETQCSKRLNVYGYIFQSLVHKQVVSVSLAIGLITCWQCSLCKKKDDKILYIDCFAFFVYLPSSHSFSEHCAPTISIQIVASQLVYHPLAMTIYDQMTAGANRNSRSLTSLFNKVIC